MTTHHGLREQLRLLLHVGLDAPNEGDLVRVRVRVRVRARARARARARESARARARARESAREELTGPWRFGARRAAG